VREPGAYVIAERTVPQYHWPSERGKAPKTCWNCGANLLYGDVPRARYDEVNIECWCCSRLQCTLISDLRPRRLTPDEWRACVENQPKIGRPKKPGPRPTYPDNAGRQRAHRQRDAAGLVNRSRWARDYDACIVCGETEYRHNAHGCCMKCRDRSQEPYREARRTGR
jgi:hypothetical protein